MEETEECAQLGSFRMADVTVMHSVVIKATGSTATETVLEDAMLLPFLYSSPKLKAPLPLIGEELRPRMGSSCECDVCPEVSEDCGGASLLMII